MEFQVVNMNGGDLGVPAEPSVVLLRGDPVSLDRLVLVAERMAGSPLILAADHALVFPFHVPRLGSEGLLDPLVSGLPKSVHVFEMETSCPNCKSSRMQRVFPLYASSGGIRSLAVAYLVKEAA